MKIIGIDGLSDQQVLDEIQKGGKFVIYEYCISIVLMTFKRSSNIHFIKSGKSRFSKGLGFSLISFLFGWWGIPWRPIYTLGTLAKNISGGRDVTAEVLGTTQPQSPA